MLFRFRKGFLDSLRLHPDTLVHHGTINRSTRDAEASDSTSVAIDLLELCCLLKWHQVHTGDSPFDVVNDAWVGPVHLKSSACNLRARADFFIVVICSYCSIVGCSSAPIFGVDWF